jgi:tetratricopeptide (TPR) repeat protein
MADRYAYLPAIGLFVMVCWGVASSAEQKRVSTAWLRGVAVAALLLLALVTHLQLGYWQDSITLWTRTLQVTHRNYIAQDNLGWSLLARHETEAAMQHFQAAVAIEPDDPLGNFYIGWNAQMQGDLPRAIQQYKKVVNGEADTHLRFKALGVLCDAYREAGDKVHAEECSRALARFGK